MPALTPDRLARRCDPADMPFETTAEAAGPGALVGHTRALQAISYAVDVELEGYNLFVMGEAGVGKTRFVRSAIARHAKGSEHADWVYLNHFAEPDRPIAVGLPQGRGSKLREDMRRLVDELKATIPAAFESDDYRAEVERIQAEMAERQTQALSALNDEATRDGIALVRTPNGFSLAPVKDNDVMSPDDFGKLPEADQKRLRERIEALQEQLQRVMREGMRLRKEQIERVRKLNHDTTEFAVGHVFDEIRAEWAQPGKVHDWLAAVHADVLENADDFLRAAKDAPANPFVPPPDLARYEVNLLTTRSGDDPAPMIEVEFPTHANLIGRIDYRAQFGTLITDFRLIRAGALHRANGGYLLIDARKLLTEPFAWASLKRALYRRSIQIESIAEQYGAASPARLEPEPIPLAVKVILFGERELYELLSRYDPDFARLFRVVADFDDDLARDGPVHAGLAGVIAAESQARRLLPLDRAAVARVIDFGSRLAGDATRVTAQVQRLLELAVEADQVARRGARARVGVADVEAAWAAQRDRAARAQGEYQRAVLRGVLMIDTAGQCVGQVNALAVHEVAGQVFGHPSRVTATVWPGEGRMIDIQRETRMGGALHTKGVLILSSFLAARYSARRPLALNASLVFEQSYGPVEGDSATVAEICAVLSALSGLPILQSLAITGSMNQLGEVQPIGGVNEKIEGFFELCAARGLSGGQGVIVPAANVDHLMLRDDVIRAVADGRFHVHAVSHVDEAVALLTGVPAGAVGAGPGEPSVNGRVAARLRELFELRGNGRAGAGARGGGRALVRVVTRDAGGGSGAGRRRGGGDG